MNIPNISGFLAVVLLMSGLCCPAVAIPFFFVAVILAAVWILDQCGPADTSNK